MAQFEEAGKGVSMFILIHILLYLAWETTISPLIEAVTTITSEPYLKATVWISLIAVYITTGIIYPIYAIIINTEPDKHTNFIAMIKSVIYWMLGTIACILIFAIINPLADALTSITFTVTTMGGATTTTSNAGIITTTQLIAWLGVLVCYIMYLLILPINQMTKGFQGTD